MDATGVYHEAFTYHLDEKGYALSIVDDKQVKNEDVAILTKANSLGSD
jgi:hypothetical protein